MEDFIKNAKTLMDKAIKFLEEEYKLIKAGRANPKILDKVFINYYGSKTPIHQLSPWDVSLLKEIEREI